MILLSLSWNSYCGWNSIFFCFVFFFVKKIEFFLFTFFFSVCFCFLFSHLSYWVILLFLFLNNFSVFCPFTYIHTYPNPQYLVYMSCTIYVFVRLLIHFYPRFYYFFFLNFLLAFQHLLPTYSLSPSLSLTLCAF